MVTDLPDVKVHLLLRTGLPPICMVHRASRPLLRPNYHPARKHAHRRWWLSGRPCAWPGPAPATEALSRLQAETRGCTKPGAADVYKTSPGWSYPCGETCLTLLQQLPVLSIFNAERSACHRSLFPNHLWARPLSQVHPALRSYGQRALMY